jgi:membrane protein
MCINRFRLPRLKESLKVCIQFLKYTWSRFQQDQLLHVAAALSYTSLLSLVPLLAISFAAFAAFPVFSSSRDQIQAFILNHLLPEQGAALSQHLEQFLANTGSLTAIGIIGLALTAILLLNTIESTFNQLFRVSQKRPLIARFLMFWAVITLGPLLLGASLSLSTTLFAASHWLEANWIAGFNTWLVRCLPNLFIGAALVLFYVVIPNRPVPIRNALIGSIVATFLFSLLRKGFGFYVMSTGGYVTLYGAAAIVPLFLIWMYLTWAVVLLGAEMTAVLTTFKEKAQP